MDATVALATTSKILFARYLLGESGGGGGGGRCLSLKEFLLPEF